MMSSLLTYFTDFLGSVALTTIDTYSWIGMYEPKKPECLMKYKG